MRIQKRGEKLICPHCEEPESDNVEDWVIAGKTGVESSAEGQCGNCDGWFEVTSIGNDQFEVEEIEVES